jgi:hypothetical protein
MAYEQRNNTSSKEEKSRQKRAQTFSRNFSGKYATTVNEIPFYELQYLDVVKKFQDGYYKSRQTLTDKMHV